MTALFAYIGPGAGLGFLGSLLAVVAVIAVGVLGLLIYPLKLVLGCFARSQAPLETACQSSASTSGSVKGN